MSKSILHGAPAHTLAAATTSILGVLAMTAIHHVYGAVLFATPWRLHIVFISVPVALAILAAVPLGRASPDGLLSSAASWVYLALGGVFAIGAIGVYEGGYNHLLPNLQHVLGVEHTLREGLYVPPDDLVFQLTGVAQFVIAVIAARYMWRLVGVSRPADRLADPA